MTAIQPSKKMEQRLAKFKQSPQKDILLKLAQEGQNPEAIIVTCSDSRVAPEILFDAEIGQFFVIRIAGNIVGPDALASIEYASIELNIPVCIVLGHSSCGAVSASLDWHLKKRRAPTNFLMALIEEIEPAVKTAAKNPSNTEENLLPAAVSENVYRTMKKISTKSSILAEKIQNGEFIVKGGVIDMNEVAVEWLS